MATNQAKAVKGAVGVEVFRNKLRLRLPRTIVKEGSRYISTGLENLPENFKKAQITAWEIESDISNGIFDATLQKYQPQKHLAVVLPIKPKTALKLDELWEQFTDYKAQLIEQTTIKTNYKRIKNTIELFPSKNIEDAVAIRDWLLANKYTYTAKVILSHLSECCDWGVQSQLIHSNPFQDMAIKATNTKQTEDIDPFSATERDAIVEAFQNDRYYSHYTNFLRFLFMNGCRTGEAIALRWKDINPEMTQITFSESFSSHFKIRKGTKTHKSRKLPMAQLKGLLQSIKPQDCTAETLVFPSPTGKEIDGHNFLNRAWKGYKNRHGKFIPGIVTRLVTEGKVERYRCVYNTRHTLITTALEANVSVIQVAKWVGNSPEIILKHYTGTLQQIQVPEF
jgi:integrase